MVQEVRNLGKSPQSSNLLQNETTLLLHANTSNRTYQPSNKLFTPPILPISWSSVHIKELTNAHLVNKLYNFHIWKFNNICT